ncbi:uncharacterized protein LOC109600149 isoform X2 [Aethina tumida]|uniref:uncharacterized protein LOC109600149 isoform X2 n=1 Tax=Aethina tumida TaxID=116153 RepID=UPI00096B481C|nr:uncharacterized protein LOC109600149 isoform X2 [Aethina tumida]
MWSSVLRLAVVVALVFFVHGAPKENLYESSGFIEEGIDVRPPSNIVQTDDQKEEVYKRSENGGNNKYRSGMTNLLAGGTFGRSSRLPNKSKSNYNRRDLRNPLSFGGGFGKRSPFEVGGAFGKRFSPYLKVGGPMGKRDSKELENRQIRRTPCYLAIGCSFGKRASGLFEMGGPFGKRSAENGELPSITYLLKQRNMWNDENKDEKFDELPIGSTLNDERYIENILEALFNQIREQSSEKNENI